MKNKIIFILLLLVFCLSFFIVYDKLIFNKINLNDKNINIDISNEAEIRDDNNFISLDEAINNDFPLSFNINKIKGDFNYSTLVLEKFNLVDNLDDFLLFEDKYGSEIILFTSLKLYKLDVFMKYFYFTNLRDGITNKLGLSDQELTDKLKKIFSDFSTKGFLKDMSYFNSNGEPDYFMLSIISLSIEEKLNICKDIYSDLDIFESCEKNVIFMYSTKENGYCDKMNKINDKKWCTDTLKLIEN